MQKAKDIPVLDTYLDTRMKLLLGVFYNGTIRLPIHSPFCGFFFFIHELWDNVVVLTVTLTQIG